MGTSRSRIGQRPATGEERSQYIKHVTPASRSPLLIREKVKERREQLKFKLDNLDFSNLDSAFDALKSFVDHCKDVSD